MLPEYISRMIQLKKDTINTLELTKISGEEGTVCYKVTSPDVNDEDNPLIFKPFFITVDDKCVFRIKGINPNNNSLPKNLMAYAVHMLAYDLSFADFKQPPTFFVNPKYEHLIEELKAAGFTRVDTDKESPKHKYFYSPNYDYGEYGDYD